LNHRVSKTNGIRMSELIQAKEILNG